MIKNSVEKDETGQKGTCKNLPPGSNLFIQQEVY